MYLLRLTFLEDMVPLVSLSFIQTNLMFRVNKNNKAGDKIAAEYCTDNDRPAGS
jgi:hypothetical protein